MFEQASIDTRGLWKSPWALTASLGGQTFIVSVGILVSLIHRDALPRGFSMIGVTTPRSSPPTRVPAADSRRRRAPETSAHLFVSPTETKSAAKASGAEQLLLSDVADIGSGAAAFPPCLLVALVRSVQSRSARRLLHTPVRRNRESSPVSLPQSIPSTSARGCKRPS